MECLILASSSPRRKEILDALSIPYIAVSPDLDESLYDALKPEFRVRALAEAKALVVKQALAAGHALRSERATEADRTSVPAPTASAPSAVDPPRNPRCIIAADTLVVVGSGTQTKVIGKPATVDEARAMLGLLEGKTHRVYSGLCLLDLETGERNSVVAYTKLRFATMSPREIETYLACGEWEGAAGAYRIQGQASYFIEGIEGSFSCVVGLPIRELYVILTRAGYEFTPVKGALRTPTSSARA